ncbi:hypothetical protein B0H10DRAFT_2194575 [Mycena sp. CBHHK59/15]|nr:hypothetical protein B0H10DRAFT_2194575 [Mycena sp. CBHHK59/15]
MVDMCGGTIGTHLSALCSSLVTCNAQGWNLNRHRMTIRTFYRWFYLIDDHHRDHNVKILLRKIHLTRLDVLRYRVDTVEEPLLSRESEDLLKPGTYGPFLDGKPYTGEVGDDSHQITFQKMEASFESEALRCAEPSITILGKSYKVRDWQKKDLFDEYKTIDNVITFCSALVGPFTQNIFSIDVEVHNFWRLNFKWTLGVYFLGGDTSRDYRNTEPSDLMTELDEEYDDLNDPK